MQNIDIAHSVMLFMIPNKNSTATVSSELQFKSRDNLAISLSCIGSEKQNITFAYVFNQTMHEWEFILIHFGDKFAFIRLPLPLQ